MNTITLEFKAVKLKIPTENLTLEALEQMTFDTRQEIAKTALVNALRQYDDVLRQSRPRGMLKNIRSKSKYLQTKIGEIPYRRTLYREKATNKARYLLDEALGLDINQRMSISMAKIMGTLAAMEPYRQVRDQISELLGMSWSHEAIRQTVISEGKRIEKREAKEYQKIKELDYDLPQDLPEVVYNEVDATYIRKQNKGKKKGRKKRHFEVKLGVGYTGKEARYAKGRKISKKLRRKIVYSEVKADRNAFMERFSCISEKEFGLSAVKETYLGGDGAGWIREGRREYFTRAVYLLCSFHLWKNLRQALPGKKRLQQRLKRLFEKNEIDKTLFRIRRIMRMIRSRKLKKKLCEFYTYVINNRKGIEASTRIRMDKNTDSAGAIEPNIDKLIAHRFKGRGMSWSEQGAQSLLKIRQTIANGQWEDWWYKERGKNIEVKAIFKELLTAGDMNKRREIAPFIEAELPCYRGPDHSKPWVGILQELTRARQFS